MIVLKKILVTKKDTNEVVEFDANVIKSSESDNYIYLVAVFNFELSGMEFTQITKLSKEKYSIDYEIEREERSENGET